MNREFKFTEYREILESILLYLGDVDLARYGKGSVIGQYRDYVKVFAQLELKYNTFVREFRGKERVDLESIQDVFFRESSIENYKNFAKIEHLKLVESIIDLM